MVFKGGSLPSEGSHERETIGHVLSLFYRTALTFMLFVARAFISGAFQTAYVYTPEVGSNKVTYLRCIRDIEFSFCCYNRLLFVIQVYPTTTRAVGLGACSGMARIGAIVTPFVAQVMSALLSCPSQVCTLIFPGFNCQLQMKLWLGWP